MKRTALLSLCTLISFAGCIYYPGSPGKIDYSNLDISYDRSHFGEAPFPFWFHCTPFEVQTLRNVARAREGDPDAVLALALLASGDARDSAAFDKFRGRIDAFVNKVRPRIESQQDFWHRGYALYQAMRAEFMPADSVKELAGYAWEQSRLSEFLRTGTYNCISSALLYMVLARHFQLHPKGVLLASHAFVQLEGPGEKIIEVETTSKTGFDWVHDADYYKSRPGSWFGSRGLKPSTWEEYKNRKILEPWQLVCVNMANQHTDPRRMKIEDIHRLKEMMGFVDEENAAYQRERLNIYRIEFHYLQERKDFAAAARLFEVIAPVIASALQRFPADRELLNNVAVLQYNEATMLLMQKKLDAFVRATKASFQSVKDGGADSVTICRGGLINVANYIKQCAGQDDYGAAESLSIAFLPFARGEPWFVENVQWAYGMALRHFWGKSDWIEVVRIAKQQKRIDPEGKYRQTNDKNIEGAYMNWTIGFASAGDWPKAREVLKKCECDSLQQTECTKMLKDLEKSHRF